MNPDQNQTPPRPPQSEIGLGGDAPVTALSGIAPAVVDAFLNANARRPAPEPAPAAVTDPEPAASPRSPESLGDFPALDTQAVKQRQMKIRHLAALMAQAPEDDPPPAAGDAPPAAAGGPPAGPAAPGASPSADPARPGAGVPRPVPPTPPAPPSRSPSGALSPDDVRAKHLAMRKQQLGTGHLGQGRGGTGRLPSPGTGPLPGVVPPEGPAAGAAPNDIRLQHLAMRRKQLGTGRLDGPGPDGHAKLEKMVEAALGAEGAISLRATIEALEDRAVSSKLAALTDRVSELVPGNEGMIKLGADVGKRALVNSLNPVLALSIAAKESAEKIDTLRKWNDLSTKERMAATAGLSANLAEILGAVTPPPVCFGAQVAAVGLTLVSLATDHSDTIEDVAAKAAGAETSRKVASEISERGAVLASQVKAAWGELGERLETIKAGKKLRPRAPKQLQLVFDSKRFKKLKKNPTTRALAEGFENLTYNLTQRFDAQKASWAHRFEKMRRKDR
jgi:hypothetical protein